MADVDDHIQMSRVMQRDNITAEDFKKIISMQNDKNYTRNKADYVIRTNLPYGVNKVQLIKFIQEIL